MRQIPIVKRKVTYETVMVDMLQFLKQQKYFELVNNRELRTVDIRLPTLVEGYSHFVACVHQIHIQSGDLDWLTQLRSDNRELEFIEKYQHKFVWLETDRNCSINTEGLC